MITQEECALAQTTSTVKLRVLTRLIELAGFFRLLMKGFLILMYCDLLTKS